jgi:hypothetical protein
MPPISSGIVGYTELSYAYNRLYTDKRLTDSAERDHPRFYRTPKVPGLEGEGLFYRIIYGDPQGIASGEDNFATAATNVSGIEGKQLSITAKIKYGRLRLKGPAVRRARSSKAAVYDLVTRHVNGKVRQLGADLALDLQGDGNGIRGRIASAGISGNTITLENKWTTDLFKQNMTIRASSSSDGSSPRTGSTFVTKVLRESKQIVVDDASDITSLTAGDYLFRETDPGNLMQGLGVCTPLAAVSTSDSFRGINRSADAELLSGWRSDDTSKYPEEAILDTAAFAFSHGKTFLEADVPAQAFANMVKRLGAKVMYEPGRTADVGFRYIEIHGSGTSIKVFSEPDMKDQQISRLYGASEDHELRYTGGDGFIHPIRDDNNSVWMRLESSDAIGANFVCEHEYLQYDPGRFGVVRHAA